MTDSTTATASASSIASGTSGTQLATSASTLGESDFLELMMDQLKDQNPLSPADPTQYVSELASFSSLEEEMQVATNSQTAATQDASSEAVNLIGKSVTYTSTSGSGQTGTVSSVQFTSSGPTLTIGSTSGISLSAVTGVAGQS
jgi:flagellar basal-body rod modification protein FlgD